MDAVISDIDGTLLRNGLTAIPKNIAYLQSLMGRKIILITGRTEDQRLATERALHAAHVPFSLLLMNSLGPSKADQVRSKTLHAQQVMKTNNVVAALDNDRVMRSAYSRLGIKEIRG